MMLPNCSMLATLTRAFYGALLIGAEAYGLRGVWALEREWEILSGKSS